MHCSKPKGEDWELHQRLLNAPDRQEIRCILSREEARRLVEGVLPFATHQA